MVGSRTDAMRAISARHGISSIVFAGSLFAAGAAAQEASTADLTPRVPAVANFPVPEALTPAVDFWRELFLRHGSDRVVLHDREHLETIWQVLELPRDIRTGLVDERIASKRTHEAVEALRERLRRLESDRTPIDEIDATLLSSVNADVLPGAWERIRAQRGVADQFRAGMSRCKQWLKEIRHILRQEGVPEEIAALPFVESMFNPKARSSVGAVGVWQLMPATARGLGLKISRRSGDERSNVLKATRAAARMLRQNYRMLGSWPLAITAYNHGPNGVRRAVNLVGSNDLAFLIDNYQRSTWGFASKNFYAEFLAAMAVVANGATPAISSSTVVAVPATLSSTPAPSAAPQNAPSAVEPL